MSARVAAECPTRSQPNRAVPAAVTRTLLKRQAETEHATSASPPLAGSPLAVAALDVAPTAAEAEVHAVADVVAEVLAVADVAPPLPTGAESQFDAWVTDNILSKLQGKISALAAFGATARAGLMAYDPDTFTTTLRTDKKYECCLPIDYFELWAFPHGPDGRPTIGAVERIYKALFLNPATGQPDTAGTMSEAVLVRVASTNEFPIRGKVLRNGAGVGSRSFGRVNLSLGHRDSDEPTTPPFR
jgi:hypothetical protein